MELQSLHWIKIKLLWVGCMIFNILIFYKLFLENLKIDHPKIEIVPVDLGDWENATKIIKTAFPIDLLVNNAGIGYVEPLTTVTEEQYDRYLH